MRRRGALAVTALVAAALVGATLSGCAGRGAGADATTGGVDPACEAPSITVDPTAAAPGATVTVTGRAFLSDCGDVFGVDENGATLYAIHADPYVDVAVALLADGATLTTTRASADELGAFRVELTVPADVAPGSTLTVTAEHAQTAAAVSVTAGG